MLGQDYQNGLELIKSLNGQKVIIAGNHDTNKRRELYENELGLKVFDATTFSYNGYHFYLSHYPTFTSNLEKEHLKQCIINLYGHTHQKTNFYNDIPFMYHVSVDSHNNYPINIDSIIKDIIDKVEECKNYL